MYFYLPYSDKLSLSCFFLLARRLGRLRQHVAEGPPIQHVLGRKGNLNIAREQTETGEKESRQGVLEVDPGRGVTAVRVTFREEQKWK